MRITFEFRHTDIQIATTNYLRNPTDHYYLRNTTDPLRSFLLGVNQFYTELFMEDYGPLLFTEPYSSNKFLKFYVSQ